LDEYLGNFSSPGWGMICIGHPQGLIGPGVLSIFYDALDSGNSSNIHVLIVF